MAIIESLVHDEAVQLDSEKLDALYRQLGPVAAENVVCRAIEELAIRLSDLAPMLFANRIDALSRLAHSLIAIADQVGLQSVASAAEDVFDCANAGDRTALAATLSRLERVGDKSLMAVWDIQDMRV
ncbi:hypothetical protein [Tropicimonas marinistellae]|uniref:hypothetical protein n=1 Tax=Tropicimonas marinistellae TaxID=1739787 RepID=UPI001F280DFD|nr:hypothetical protein [Tropicimonas marinistellae]